MQMERCVKPSFAVIGKEGSTQDGPGFIQKLWQDANTHFVQVQPFAKVDDQGQLLGIWGAMSDFSRSFQPWEEGFTQGLYLAGAECEITAEAPEGWTKWVIPGYEYLYTEQQGDSTFAKGLAFLEEHRQWLAGAVHDFTCPQTGRNYLFFPIRKL